MSRPKWMNYGLVFLGAFLVFGGIAVGLGALHYEFVLVSAAETPPESADFVYDYGELPADEQRVVDGAIEGERYVFDRTGPVPGAEKSTLRAQEMTVRKGETYYVFTHEIIFVSTEPMGLAAFALVLTGLFSVGEAIRSEEFPHRRYPWQSR